MFLLLITKAVDGVPFLRSKREIEPRSVLVFKRDTKRSFVVVYWAVERCEWVYMER